MIVADAMTSAPLSVPADMQLHQALVTMRDHEVRHLLIVDGRQRLVGMLSDRDLKRHMSNAFETKLERPRDRMLMLAPVDQVMTRNPHCALEGQPLSDVVALMYERKYGAVPVIDDEGRPVGILSSIDLLRVLQQRL